MQSKLPRTSLDISSFLQVLSWRAAMLKFPTSLNDSAVYMFRVLIAFASCRCSPIDPLQHSLPSSNRAITT
jgi:hypothetical protein